MDHAPPTHRPPTAHGPLPPPPPAPPWQAGPPRRSRLPSTAEVLGWGGGSTTVIGVVAVTWDFWARIPDGVLVGLLLLASGVLGVAASVVGDLDRGDDRLAANLSTALWWMTGVAATYASYVSADVIAGGRAHLPLLAASSAATAMAGAAAHRTGRDGPLACAVVSAAVAGFSAAALAGLEVPARAGAVALVTSSAAIGLIAAGPRRWRTTWATSVVLLLGSTQAVLATGAATWLVVPTALVVTGVAAGAWLRRSTGEAVAASTVAVAFAGQVLYDVAPQVFSLSTTILVVGIAMVVGCIAVVRRATRSGG